MRSSFVRVRGERSRRPAWPMNPSTVGATWAITSGWRFWKSAISSISFGWRVTTSSSNTVLAQSGRSPTIERTFSRNASPSGSRRTS